jgi:hypothetical protein
MTEPRRVYVGTIPAGAELHDFGGAIAGQMLREAGAKLDAERLAEAKALAAKVADIERAKNTRRARAAQRFKRALSMFRGG